MLASVPASGVGALVLVPPRRTKPLSPLSPCATPVGDSVVPRVIEAIRLDAQSFFHTPSSTPVAAAGVGAARSAAVACAFGNSACPRSFQVISGTAASIRLSVPASISDSAPPYDPPVTPTRGSPGAS